MSAMENRAVVTRDEFAALVASGELTDQNVVTAKAVRDGKFSPYLTLAPSDWEDWIPSDATHVVFVRRS